MEIISQIKKDFFKNNKDIICVDSTLGHRFENGMIFLGWSGNSESKEEMLLHEMGHLIEARDKNIFAKDNWGFKKGYSGYFDNTWLKKVIANEIKVMNMTYRLLTYYEVDSWMLSYSDYADLMTNGFDNSLKSFFDDMDSYYDLEDWLGEPISHYFYSELMENLESIDYSFSEIKYLWDSKIEHIRSKI